MLYAVTIQFAECPYRGPDNYGPARQLVTRVVEAEDMTEAIDMLNLGDDVERVEINPVRGEILRTTPDVEICSVCEKPFTHGSDGMCDHCNVQSIGF